MANEIHSKTIAATYGKLLITKSDSGFSGSGAGNERVIATDDKDGSITESCLAVGTARVGIGTASPGAPLQINKAAGEGAALETMLSLVLSDGGVDLADGHGPSIDFYIPEDGGSEFGARIGAVRGAASGVDATANAELVFYTSVDDTSPSEKVRIDASGNVGIGTTSPQIELHVDSAAQATAVALTYSKASGTMGNTNTLGVLNFGGKDDNQTLAEAYGAAAIQCDASGNWDADNRGTMLRFNTTIGETTSTAMTIEKNGYVGIGTASPSSEFEVWSDSGSHLQMSLWCQNSAGGDPLIRFGGRADTAVSADADFDWGIGLDRSANKFSMLYNSGGISTADDANKVLTINTSGYVGIGETAPDAKLCINAQAGEHFLTLKANDIAHGLTSNAANGALETDTLFCISEAANQSGGVIITAISDTARTPMRFYTYGGLAPDETTTTSAFGEFTFHAVKHNESDTLANHGADANLFTVHNGASATGAKFIVKGDGDIYYDGASAAYDTYNDAHLIRAFDVSDKNIKGLLDSEWDKYVEYNEDTLVKAGILGDTRENGGLVSVGNLQKLHNGAIWQQYTEMQKMKELMYDAMVELMGKEKADEKLDSHDIKLLDEGLLN